MPPSCAYVIVDYGTPGLATRAADSICRVRPEPEPPIVVVDALELGLGYSAALNAGIAKLPGETPIVCCLNADVEMLEDDAPVLLRFRTDDRLAIIGPLQIDGEERVVHGGIVAHEDGTDWDLDLRHRCWHFDAREERTRQLTRVEIDVPTVAGSVFYVRADRLREFGGWPEWTRFYYEDTWLCYLARYRGYRVLYSGAISWRHLGERSTVDRDWRIDAMRAARERFIYECGRAGIPLRTLDYDEVPYAD